MLVHHTDSKPLVPMTAREFMFGYESTLVTLGNKMMPSWIKFDKLGLIDRVSYFCTIFINDQLKIKTNLTKLVSYTFIIVSIARLTSIQVFIKYSSNSQRIEAAPLRVRPIRRVSECQLPIRFSAISLIPVRRCMISMAITKQFTLEKPMSASRV